MSGENPDDDALDEYISIYEDEDSETPDVSDIDGENGGGGDRSGDLPFIKDDERILDVGLGAVLALSGMVMGVVGLSVAFVLFRLSPVAIPESVMNVLLMLVLQVVGLAGTAAAYLYITDRNFGFVRLRFPSLKHVGIGVGTVFAMLTAVVAVGFVIETIGASAAQHGTVETIEQNPSFALYMIPLSLLVIGPCEEFLFRGVIQTRMGNSFSVKGAIGVTSAIFALVHVPAYGGLSSGVQGLLTTLSILFSLSLILGWAYERTENLFVSILAHGLYNATLFSIVYVSTQYSEELEETGAAVVGVL